MTDETNEDTSKAHKELTPREVSRKWDEGREDIAPQRAQYWENSSFWLGCQWVLQNPTSNLIEPVTTNTKKRREQATVNKIESAVNTTIARLMKAMLSFEVPSEGADDHQRLGAQKGESILRARSVDDDWEELKEEWLTALILGGTAGIADVWNPDANKYSNDIKTGEPELFVLSLDDMVVEPGSAKAKTARWWEHKQILPAESVQAMFDLPDKPVEDGIDGGPWSDKAMQFNNKLSQKRGTQVLWYYERPNGLRPKGAIAAVVGKQFVWGDESSRDKDGNITKAAPWSSCFPYTDHLNLHVGRAIVLPNKWYGESYVTQALSPQRQINHTWTKIHENTHRVMGAKLMIDNRHAELNKQLSDDTEEPIKLSPADGASDPKYLEAPKIPPHVMTVLEALNMEIDNILGVHDVSRGDSPNNIESGYGLSILSENDSTPTGKLAKETARVFSGVASDVLKLYAAKVTETRQANVIEGRGRSRPVKWTGKELAGQTRAIVPPDSTLPHSEAAMLKMAMDLLMKRPDWFPNITSFLKLAFVPGVENFTYQMDDDIALAMYENYLLGQGQEVLTNDFDDHAKHIQEHNHYCKSPEYMALPDKTKQLIRLHIDGHKAGAAHDAGITAGMDAMHPQLGAAQRQITGAPPLDPNAPPALPPGAGEVPPPDQSQGGLI